MTFFLNHPWVAITIGTILVGTGGWIATWGWNQSSELANRENLIAAVVKEWGINVYSTPIRTAIPRESG